MDSVWRRILSSLRGRKEDLYRSLKLRVLQAGTFGLLDARFARLPNAARRRNVILLKASAVPPGVSLTIVTRRVTIGFRDQVLCGQGDGGGVRGTPGAAHGAGIAGAGTKEACDTG